MNYWFPNLPNWIPGIVAVALLMGANLVSVKAFGEFEFWFALIKVVTIILMIIAGFGLILFGIGNGGHAVGISNLWTHGGFMPNGIVDSSSPYQLLSVHIKVLNLLVFQQVKLKSSKEYC